ncbi:MAG: hypothetical protein SGJ20_04220, partial [Planctomycetota bacterium]|nr:hypothetical protein [Planctomycetota bacterium]
CRCALVVSTASFLACISGCAGTSYWNNSDEQSLSSDGPVLKTGNDDPLKFRDEIEAKPPESVDQLAADGTPKKGSRKAADRSPVADNSATGGSAGDSAASGDPSPRSRQETAAKIAARRTTSPDDVQSLPADASEESLMAAVRQLGLESPADEAKTLSALKEMKPEDRAMLLRTFQVGARAKKRIESGESADSQTPIDTRSTNVSVGSGAGQEPAFLPTNLAEARAMQAEKTRQQIAAVGINQNGNTLPTVFKNSNHLPLGSSMSLNDRAMNSNPAAVNLAQYQQPVDSGTYAPLQNAVSELPPVSANPNSVIPQVGLNTGNATALPQVQLASGAVPATNAAVGSDAMSANWQAELNSTIAMLEQRGRENISPAEQSQLQTKLRLLYLLADRREDALKPIEGLTTEQQEFWTKELFGLATLLDHQRLADERVRVTAAAGELREAAKRLADSGNLVVQNLHFCSEVKGYGIFTKFESDEFKPGQEVLLYAEVENFRSRSTPKGYHTALKGSYQIFDKSGRRIAEKELAIKEEYCQNQRRDFFVPYFLWIPKQADDGEYTLKLTIDDVQRSEVAESTVTFKISNGKK